MRGGWDDGCRLNRVRWRYGPATGDVPGRAPHEEADRKHQQ
ncbi:hypothetical protein FTUN_1291 [Frigoriglobus tundricola]|uniref:Uncharacterized protein n=1 Tax=Frigoriglobus tundricola TaxID=2774151 RepID=A0A6M5YKB7_9BACT|nr:hypothetical protein FTUN_1291 [Frigoriglobus tundricola]